MIDLILFVMPPFLLVTYSVIQFSYRGNILSGIERHVFCWTRTTQHHSAPLRMFEWHWVALSFIEWHWVTYARLGSRASAQQWNRTKSHVYLRSWRRRTWLWMFVWSINQKSQTFNLNINSAFDGHGPLHRPLPLRQSWMLPGKQMQNKMQMQSTSCNSCSQKQLLSLLPFRPL